MQLYEKYFAIAIHKAPLAVGDFPTADSGTKSPAGWAERSDKSERTPPANGISRNLSREKMKNYLEVKPGYSQLILWQPQKVLFVNRLYEGTNRCGRFDDVRM
jgi:hypothetical protein